MTFMGFRVKNGASFTATFNCKHFLNMQSPLEKSIIPKREVFLTESI